MRHATGFGHAVGNQCLVASVIIADKRATSGVKELLGMLAGPAIGEIVDDRLDRLEGADAVRPQVGPMRLSLAGSSIATGVSSACSTG